MEYTLFILTEKIFGFLLLMLGLSIAIQNRYWVQTVKHIYSLNEKSLITFSMLSSYLFLPLGLGIVIVHNKWEWSPSTIITVLGWIIVIKCLSVLLYPKITKTYLKIYENKSDLFLKRLLTSLGIGYMLLALWVLSQHWL